MSKGKVQRDRRKLREKRRSTGVVHLQSTEVSHGGLIFRRSIDSIFFSSSLINIHQSTGGSTGEDDGEESPSWDETKKNTLTNEGGNPFDVSSMSFINVPLKFWIH